MDLSRGVFLTRIRFKEDCSKYIKKEYYELLIWELMKHSKKFFNDKSITWCKEQSKGEPDFIDGSGVKYDAKLIIDTIQGSMLGRDKGKDVVGFFREIQRELMEFGDKMKRDGELSIQETKFFKIVKKRVLDCKFDENIILFIPFPIGLDIEESIIWNRLTDCAQSVYNAIRDENLVGDRDFYYIYPMRDGMRYVIRNPKNNERDYILLPEYQDSLCFEIVEKD